MFKEQRQKNYVYRIQSISDPEKYYTGLCSDFKNRLKEHNTGECQTTRLHQPWKSEIIIFFQDPTKAHQFERYLKTGSGRAFAKRHF